MKFVLLIDRWLERIAGWSLVFLLGMMILMAFGQVLLRNLFHTSISWGDVFLRHLVLWVGYFGAVIATGEGRHLKIEFIAKLVSPKVRKVFLVITSFYASVVCFFLMQASVVFVQLEIESSTKLMLDLPSWYFVVILPAGYAMISFRFLIRSVSWSTEAIRGNWEITGVHH